MRNLLLISSLFLSSGAYALGGLDLAPAMTASFEAASFEIELDEIEAWSAELHGDEVETIVLAHNHETDTEVKLQYGCHYHGTEMECHEEGDHHKILKEEQEGGFSEMQLAHQTGMAKLRRTLSRRGQDLTVLQSIKVWKTEGDHDHKDDDHGEGSDVWTKATVLSGGALMTTFIQCHKHGAEDADYFCHYKREGEGEPDLEGDHDHDHNHD